LPPLGGTFDVIEESVRHPSTPWPAFLSTIPYFWRISLRLSNFWKAAEMDKLVEASSTRTARKITRLHGGYRSVAERRAAGKALREKAPRASHGKWKTPADRRDPVDITLASNAGREPHLIPIRMGRMAQSPFAFYRGSAALMAADLATTPQSGPRVQACGDAHVMNFGGFATPERNVVFDINDLDETLPAPWEWDVKRLTASMVIAAQDLGLTATEAAKVAIATTREYRERMTNYASMRALEVWYDFIDVKQVIKLSEKRARLDRKGVEARIEKARQKSLPDLLFPKLAERRGNLPMIKDDPPLIYHPSEKEAPGAKSGYTKQIARYRETLPEHVRVLFDRFHLRDLAFKVVGVGSVGTVCVICLMMAADDDPLFLQVKEARHSVLEPYAGKSLHKNQGERVVAGQRLMQFASDIFLGWIRGDNDRDYYFRQLRDTKVAPTMEGWDYRALRTYGELCAWALARAHARSGDSAAIAGYMGSSDAFDNAIGEFAVDYADQNQRDYDELIKAIRAGKIEVKMVD
jgi:uncharacterized protein (DUF2252 family)